MTRFPRLRPLRRAAAWEDRFWRALEHAVPREAHAHLQTARREILLAVRSAIDEMAAGGAAKAPRARPRGSPRR
jgi:hypothetical protein